MTYITITPTKVKNRYYVARKGVGADSYYMVAECYSQDYAERIAKAMNAEPKFPTELTETKIIKNGFKRKA